MTSDKVITKIKRVTFFLRHSVHVSSSYCTVVTSEVAVTTDYRSSFCTDTWQEDIWQPIGYRLLLVSYATTRHSSMVNRRLVCLRWQYCLDFLTHEPQKLISLWPNLHKFWFKSLHTVQEISNWCLCLTLTFWPHDREMSLVMSKFESFVKYICAFSRSLKNKTHRRSTSQTDSLLICLVINSRQKHK